MTNMHETMISKLGSRICFNFRPQQNEFFFSPMGRFMDRKRDFIFRVSVNDVARELPFRSDSRCFEHVRQSMTPTELAFACSSPEIPLETTLKIRVPFYPQDEQLSLAPFFYLTVDVRNTQERSVRGEVVLGMPFEAGEEAVSLAGGRLTGAVVSSAFAFSNRERMFFQDAEMKKKFSCREIKGAFGMAVAAGIPGIQFLKDGTAVWKVDLAAGASESRTFIFAAFVDEPVMQIRGELFHFKYLEFFGGIEDVFAYALDYKDHIVRRSDLFDATVMDTTQSMSWKGLTSFAFQNFIANTWWVRDDRGAEWFTVWEGNCFYHSTVDVEFHQAIFYLLYWPRLLEMELNQWALFINEKGILAHDMGSKLEIDGQAYTHPMPVEENTNYITLLGAYWRFTGDQEAVRTNYRHARKLAGYLFSTDTTGSGLPSEGCANTFDDGSPAMQYGKEQIYHGLKMWGSYRYLQLMAEFMEDSETARQCASAMTRIEQTVNQKAWLGDHFAICLSQDANLVKPSHWSNEVVSQNGRLVGWDGSSNCHVNGLLFPMINCLESPITDDRLQTELKTAYFKTLTPFGCSNTSLSKVGWMSQNLMRDTYAAYLGLDFLSDTDRYLDYQVYMNTRHTGCFFDAINKKMKQHVTYYPRGIVAFGYLPAMIKLKMDRVSGTYSIAPLRYPTRVPLVPFADWSAERIPWCEVTLNGGEPSVKITGSPLPSSVRFDVRNQKGQISYDHQAPDGRNSATVSADAS